MAFLGMRLGPNVQFDPYTTGLQNISYAQWQQANQMFYPLENQLIQYAENPQYINQMRQQAGQEAGTAFDTAQQGQTRNLAYMGVTPTAAQSTAMQQESALARSKAVAGAENTAAQGAAQNQIGALTGLGG